MAKSKTSIVNLVPRTSPLATGAGTQGRGPERGCSAKPLVPPSHSGEIAKDNTSAKSLLPHIHSRNIPDLVSPLLNPTAVIQHFRRKAFYVSTVTKEKQLKKET